MSKNRKVRLAVAAGAAAVVIGLVATVLWVVLKDDEYTGNLANEPDETSVEFAANKLVNYLNQGNVDMDFSIRPNAETYRQAVESFEQARPSDGCKYQFRSASFEKIIGEDERGDNQLETTQGSSGIAIEHVVVDEVCGDQPPQSVEVEFGVIPDMSSWSQIVRVY